MRDWRDWIAGLCVAGILLPEAVAYSGLAHLPVAHALTGTLVGLALYGLLGGSRFAIVSPTSSTAALCAAAALSMSTVDTYAQVFMALVLVSGVMLVVLAVARQGQLSSFVSRPVLRGFAFALAITIVIKQLPDALGLNLVPGVASDPAHLLWFAASHVADWHLASVAVAVVAAVLLTVLKRWPQIPASLLVMVLALFAAQALNLQTLGVQEIGSFERPALRPAWPDLPFNEWLRVVELAFGLVMLIFAESWGSMRTTALQHGDRLNANKELAVLGACNMGAALLQGMAVGAGFSATAANAGAGAQSRTSGLVALAVVAAALLWALPALHLLPRPVLAVVVINALWHSLSPGPILALWRMNRDRLLIVAAAVAVLCLGVLDGLLAAIALSVLVALQRFSQPVVHELGALGTSRNFVDVATQEDAKALPGMLILRPEEPLFFGSAERVMNEVRDRVATRADLHTVVLSLEETADLDSTAVECLMELNQALQRDGKVLVLARTKTTVRELLGRWDPQGLGKPERLFWSVADAAQSATA